MTDSQDTLPKHKNDFDRVYDLEDPSPYFTALRPADYRMPQVLAATLKAIHMAVAKARGVDKTLRLLDFACGYGAIGALLRHDISMHDIFTRYAQRDWQPSDARTYWESDAAFFSARRNDSAGFEIGGTDIAGVALEYAAALGFLDEIFHENLIDAVPGNRFREFLCGVDLVVESGSLGGLLPMAFEHVLDAHAGRRQPWFLYCPRPDVEWDALDTLWQARGYAAESLSTVPIRYRKPLGDQERADMLRITRVLGKADEAVIRDDYLLVDMTLARPAGDAAELPIEQLQDCYD